MASNYRKLEEILGDGLKQNEILAPYTTFRIGGPADYFYSAGTASDLCRAISAAEELKLNYFLLAGGSNLLINDAGFRGLIIKNACIKIEANGNQIVAESGIELQEVCDLALENSLTGMECLTGIKGSLGGAVYGNAGAFGRSIAEILESAVLFNHSGEIKIVKDDYFEFVYRGSKLKKNKEVVLSCTLQLSSGKKELIKAKMDEIAELRWTKHPHQEGSAGSFFKNIKDGERVIPAGMLLEQVQAKELRIGDAAVYHKHANILVNLGQARASEVWQITRIMKERVKDRFGIELEDEVRFLGPQGLEN
ncbi:MAG: UDP-N-acetylenolpyruvoylglucosamine reductase [candidate division Zixibacteria bacterium RBG_16_50_21]|nr:MAG: UDP-N-acetylenolpyruvoylglucosamine reductase [candidate division Zixibacteria bacterium RBG_16_50_21]